MFVELICEYCDNVLGYVRTPPPFTPPSLSCLSVWSCDQVLGVRHPHPPPVIDSRCAMNNLLMLCAIQVRGQIDFMRVGVGVGLEVPDSETLVEHLAEGDLFEIEEAHADIVDQNAVSFCAVLDHQIRLAPPEELLDAADEVLAVVELLNPNGC